MKGDRKMKKGLKRLGIFTGLFSVAFGTAFFLQYKPKLKDEIQTKPVIQPQQGELSEPQRVLNSLLTIKAFEIDGNINMVSKNNKSLGAKITGKGDLEDYSDIKFQGNVEVNLDGGRLDANLGYFGGDLFFDFNESYFKLSTDSLLDFIAMLPTNYDIGVDVPSEIKELDLFKVEEYINNMSEKEDNPGGGYYFEMDLSDKVTLFIVTDDQLNFSGIRTDTIDYNGMIFNLDIKLNRVENVELINPKAQGNEALLEKYQQFDPAFKLFDGIYALTKQKKNTINVDLDVDKADGNGGYKNFLGTNLDITYDMESENRLFALDGKVLVDKKKVENKVTTYIPTETDYTFALANKTIYAQYGDVAFSVQLDSLSALIEYIMEVIIGDDKMEELISSLVETLGKTDVTDAISQAANLLGTIVLTSDQLGINLNTSNFSKEADEEKGVKELSLSDIYLAINFDASTGALSTIELHNFTINSLKADLTITFCGYKAFTLNAADYQQIDHLMPMITFYEQYKDQTKFRFEFDATVSKEGEPNDITVDGGLQFELDPNRNILDHDNEGYGYGDVTITDRKNVKHNIYADMKSVDELLMSYSTDTGNATRDNSVDPMYVKLKVRTMKDIMDIVTEIVKEPDDHFKEITSKVFDVTAGLPIFDILDGEYEQLLATNIINSFTVGQNFIDIEIAFDILALAETSVHIRIDFDLESEETKCLKGLHIYGLEFNGLNLEFNASMEQFDTSLESTRLSKGNKYIDFSDLKVLLRLGVNTSKFNYYHFTANAKVALTIIGVDIPIDLPLDVKIWTKGGDVHISIDLNDMPTTTVAVDPADGYHRLQKRNAHVYYHDGYFYVQRIDEAKTAIFFGKDVEVEYVAKYNTADFFDDIINILLRDVVVLKSFYMNQISNAINKSSSNDYQMKYENILKDFKYAPEGHYFYFDINLAEIANNEQLTEFTLKVNTDDSNEQLVGINVKLGVSLIAGISINVQLDLELADASLVANDSNRLYAQEEFEERLINEESKYTHTSDRLI